MHATKKRPEEKSMSEVPRRQFLIATGALLAAPLAAEAQQAGKGTRGRFQLRSTHLQHGERATLRISSIADALEA
ncbi:MAG TPA: hypothetical protein VNG69_07620 [Casimicrobiaceae bacterium]|nr:hypothetical protein [Casimicrobiaceae bacterium]